MMTAPLQVISGRFHIEREVGRGAMGIVYRAFDTESRQTVALKVITAGTDPTERARLSKEGQVLSELNHPGIVRVVAFGALAPGELPGGEGTEEGTPFIAMEWFEGEDLANRQRRAPLSLRQSLDVARQVALALAAAHDAGIVHRDVKPSNIFLLTGSRDRDQPPMSSESRRREGDSSDQLIAKLVDFGVATSQEMSLLAPNGMVGTPAYMAPEQARCDAVIDTRSDVYSLGATLFELIAGRPPHMGPTSIATLARLATTPAPRLSELLLDVPERLDELVDRMLQSERDRRPASAREVAAELEMLHRDPKLPYLAHAAVTETDPTMLSGTRLVTTLVALHVATGEARAKKIKEVKEHGADALPLGVDSIVAHLGSRRAHGDEAARALELGRMLCENGASVGVATGRTRVDRIRSPGDVVDRASALAREAGKGRLLSDATTSELARGRFRFEVLPNGSTLVGSTLGRKDPSSTLRFVGREPELIAALAAYDRCVEESAPIILSVSGPPGIGKSRLGREFLGRVMARPDPPRTVRVRCESYSRAQAFGVATDALRAVLGLPKGASLEQARDAINSFPHVQDEGDLLARLLANEPFEEVMGPRGARDLLYLSMTDLVVEASSVEPCIVQIEDAQWSDPESIAWIEHLLGRSAGQSLFVMMIVRPSFWREQGQRFAGKNHVRVELKPMAMRATREIARAVIGDAADSTTLDRVAEQAAGSPLFAEELARVIASGKDLATTATIEAAIQVSLDALDDATREAVVRASVFGLSVWDAGVSAVGVPNPDAALKKLVQAELLVEHHDSRFATTREFHFKHALVRDVVYGFTNEQLRKKLHADAAFWLDSMGEDDATIAQHYDLGGEHERAAEHWEAAARRALATNSLADAVSMADRALVFASDKPTAFARAMLLDEAYSRLDPRSADRDSAIRAMGENVFDEASEVRTEGARVRYDHALASGTAIEERLVMVRERARALVLVDEEARCSATLADRYAFAGQFPLAEREAAHLLDLAERRRIVWAAVDAWQTLAIVRQTRGELASALEARRNAARAARLASLQEREATLTINVGFALTTIGARNEALQQIEAGITKANAIGSSGAVRHGQMNLLGWVATFGAESRLDATLAEPRAKADEAASGTWMVRDRITLGTLFYRGCELLRGDAAGLGRARALLKIAADAYRSTDNRDVLPVALGFWAEAERRFGNAEQAAEIAREAAALVERGAPSLLNEAPIYLALHDACVDTGNFRAARETMEHAMVPLVRRLKGLEETPYARSFLVNLPHNAGLLAAAEAYGCVPAMIERILEAPDP
jgi:serine/threonine protein kinase/tetratricopeptide (TPR) repeat protein